MKSVKPEDKVTIETTYGDLAAAYHALSHQNGHYGYPLWRIIRDEIDLNRNEEVERIYNSGPSIDYQYVEKQFLELLFPQESEESKRIRELEETILKAQQQIAELKKSKEK